MLGKLCHWTITPVIYKLRRFCSSAQPHQCPASAAWELRLPHCVMILGQGELWKCCVQRLVFSFSALPRIFPEERPVIRGGNLSKSLAVSINFDFILFLTSISEKFDPFPLFKKRLQTSIFIEFWQIYGLGSGIWFLYFPRSQFCDKHFKGWPELSEIWLFPCYLLTFWHCEYYRQALWKYQK